MPQSTKVYLSIDFRSTNPTGRLASIKLHGVPGRELENEEFSVNEKIRDFCNELIVDKIFRRSHNIGSNFEHLEIWLYDSKSDRQNLEYLIPELDQDDLKIASDISASQLRNIYILDNKVQDDKLDDWEQEVRKLFRPLFAEFVKLPEMPESLANIPLFKRVESVMSKTIPYHGILETLFFDTLIVQID
ncbi:hypothetical protein LC653_02090 [Nostoc sp. CHAB 5784]|uniref:hypothetical protein n=1 Tax=Nostoc mirabile TaxID=2907820 RepID=UPI001E56C5ED|nr:hypothetical protein [Nostoc mirabile]MCC5662751.1 hypothetical protein [Nostoc mirabile CHAB5784]